MRKWLIIGIIILAGLTLINWFEFAIEKKSAMTGQQGMTNISVIQSDKWSFKLELRSDPIHEVLFFGADGGHRK